MAASRYYNVRDVLHLFLPLLVICTALVVLGAYLVLRSLGRIRHYDHVLHELRRQHPTIGKYVE